MKFWKRKGFGKFLAHKNLQFFKSPLIKKLVIGKKCQTIENSKIRQIFSYKMSKVAKYI